MLAGLESMAAKAIIEKSPDTARMVVDHRIKLLEEEGISNPAMLLKAELDVFYAICGIERGANLDELKELNTVEMKEALEWIQRAYSNAILSKGPNSTDTQRCQQYLTRIEYLYANRDRTL
jgi:hypothetical protein